MQVAAHILICCLKLGGVAARQHLARPRSNLKGWTVDKSVVRLLRVYLHFQKCVVVNVVNPQSHWQQSRYNVGFPH